MKFSKRRSKRVAAIHEVVVLVAVEECGQWGTLESIQYALAEKEFTPEDERHVSDMLRYLTDRGSLSLTISAKSPARYTLTEKGRSKI